MHKKLEAELIHLAHQILKMNNLTDIKELKEKAKSIYENLTVLSFIDDYFVETPEVTDSKENFITEVNNLTSKKVINNKFIEESEILSKEENPISKKETSKVVDVFAPSRPGVTEVDDVVVEKETPIVDESKQLIDQTVNTIKTEAKEIAAKIKTTSKEVVKEESFAFDEEMKHSIPADVAANMFEKLEKPLRPKAKESIKPVEKIEEPRKVSDVFASSRPANTEVDEVIVYSEASKINIAKKQEVPKPIQQKEKAEESKSVSLNDRISNQKIQVGLNDRIAFVKHLFNFSQEDFNRVLSQLNSFTTEQECKDFIVNKVKPEYKWLGKEEYEERLIALVERKFK